MALLLSGVLKADKRQRWRCSAGAVTALAVFLCSTEGIAQERWELIEDFRLGGFEDDGLLLTTVGTVREHASGAVFVGQPVSGTILRIDEHGRQGAILGGRSEGPGEFRTLGNFVLRGDTLFVADPQLRRVTHFGLDGDQPGTTTFHDAASDLATELQGGRAFPVVGIGESAALAIPSAIPSPGNTIRLPLVWLSAGGERSRVITELVVPAPIEVEIGGRRIVGSPGALHDALGGHDRWTVAPDGSGIVVARVSRRDDAQFVAVTVTWIDLEPGGMSERIVFRSPARAVPERTKRELEERTVAQMAGALGAAPARLRRALAEILEPADYLPPVTDVALSTDGAAWLRGTPGDGQVIWRVVRPREGVVARVRTPEEVTLRSITPAGVWGVISDSYDVPVLIRYRIERSEGR